MNISASSHEGPGEFCGSENAFATSGNPLPGEISGSGVGLYGHLVGKKVSTSSGSSFCGMPSGQSFFHFDGNSGKVICMTLSSLLCPKSLYDFILFSAFLWVHQWVTSSDALRNATGRESVG